MEENTELRDLIIPEHVAIIMDGRKNAAFPGPSATDRDVLLLKGQLWTPQG